MRAMTRRQFHALGLAALDGAVLPSAAAADRWPEAKLPTARFLAPLLATLVSLPAAARELVVYPPPPSESAFEDCSVEVNGKRVFVYMATVNYWNWSSTVTCGARTTSGAAFRASSSATSHSAAGRRFPRPSPDTTPNTASRM